MIRLFAEILLFLSLFAKIPMYYRNSEYRNTTLWVFNRDLKFKWRNFTHWRTQKIFMGGVGSGSYGGHCIWCSLFVTSQFDIISMFPNQRFGEVSWHNNAYFSITTPLISCDIALNISYQRSKLGYRRKMNSTLRRSSS